MRKNSAVVRMDTFEPTVIEDWARTAKTNREEIFGPVVTLQSLKQKKKRCSWPMRVRMDLPLPSGHRISSRANRVAAQVQSGIIWVNCWLVRDLRTPFGGMKNSGVGREGGWEALRSLRNQKNVLYTILG